MKHVPTGPAPQQWEFGAGSQEAERSHFIPGWDRPHSLKLQLVLSSVLPEARLRSRQGHLLGTSVQTHEPGGTFLLQTATAQRILSVSWNVQRRRRNAPQSSCSAWSGLETSFKSPLGSILWEELLLPPVAFPSVIPLNTPVLTPHSHNGPFSLDMAPVMSRTQSGSCPWCIRLAHPPLYSSGRLCPSSGTSLFHSPRIVLLGFPFTSRLLLHTPHYPTMHVVTRTYGLR